MRNMDQLARSRSWAIPLVAGLALFGCGRGNEPQPSNTSDTESTTFEPDIPTSTKASGKLIKLTFDDLGGGDPVIRVYAGPGPTTEDINKTVTGTYDDGDTANGACKTKGRSVNSVTEVGEQARSSDDWIKLQVPGEPQYATAVYIDDPASVLARLDECNTASNSSTASNSISIRN